MPDAKGSFKYANTILIKAVYI